MNWVPIILSLKLAVVTTICLLIICLPIAFLITRKKSVLNSLLETLFTLPLVLPPSVLGFYLLIFFKPDSGLALFFKNVFHLDLLFSFQGLVIASILYSFPFMLSPIVNALYNFNQQLKQASYSLGKTSLQTFIQIELPLVRSAIISATALTFAHTVGEFGVVLMIGGSIPYETEVASIALFNQVQLFNFEQAHTYSLVLLSICFGLILLVNSLKNRSSIYA